MWKAAWVTPTTTAPANERMNEWRHFSLAAAIAPLVAVPPPSFSQPPTPSTQARPSIPLPSTSRTLALSPTSPHSPSLRLSTSTPPHQLGCVLFIHPCSCFASTAAHSPSPPPYPRFHCDATEPQKWQLGHKHGNEDEDGATHGVVATRTQWRGWDRHEYKGGPSDISKAGRTAAGAGGEQRTQEGGTNTTGDTSRWHKQKDEQVVEREHEHKRVATAVSAHSSPRYPPATHVVPHPLPQPSPPAFLSLFSNEVHVQLRNDDDADRMGLWRHKHKHSNPARTRPQGNSNNGHEGDDSGGDDWQQQRRQRRG
ncbi:unnamed protein product [Cyclocybe aegerita]|uniref:Uncharacterized protein n=1 Tax=Cyclocybe aegerita TaxID=1973307 RepID=A0A8S0XV55_CYCAE|nr:unnamed protein product [Cyclocybe aegerita]